MVMMRICFENSSDDGDDFDEDDDYFTFFSTIITNHNFINLQVTGYQH
jgi:hypothetical protein